MNQPIGNPAFPAALADKLKDRVVVVFGGASGIGLATAIQAAVLGARVTIIGRDETRTRQVAQEHGLAWRSADVTRRDAVDAALSGFDRVDHLVLLAGTSAVGKVASADIDHLRRGFEERVWAAVHAIRSLGDRLAQDGSVVLISGALADRPNAHGTAVLGAASAAMEALARGLALELAPIRVNTLAPGRIETPLLLKVVGDARDTLLPAMRASAPLKRLGTAQEAGMAAVFMMANGWMNGATLHVDGGVRLV